MEIPAKLEHLAETETGRRWLKQLPTTIAACVAHWDLDLGDPFPDSYVSLTAPATDPDANAVVLKIQYPHRESATEALALKAWGGRGAVKLIDYAPEHNALLMERCFPGESLATRGAERAIDVIVDLLPRLWVPVADGFGTLAAEVERWLSDLPDEWVAAARPFERSLLEEASAVLAELARTQGEQVLVNQDLHGWNVVSAQREPWLVIDPKPLVGEREFGISSVIRAYELGHSRAATLYRLDRLTDELGLDRERSRLWAFGQSITWGFEDESVVPQLIDIARWLRP